MHCTEKKKRSRERDKREMKNELLEEEFIVIEKGTRARSFDF